MSSGAEVSLKRYRYTGKERDEETGFYYHGARYYAPWLGRWMSCDPANSTLMVEGSPKQADAANLYLALNGNPTSYVDNDGRAARLRDRIIAKLMDLLGQINQPTGFPDSPPDPPTHTEVETEQHQRRPARAQVLHQFYSGTGGSPPKSRGSGPSGAGSGGAATGESPRPAGSKGGSPPSGEGPSAPKVVRGWPGLARIVAWTNTGVGGGALEIHEGVKAAGEAESPVEVAAGSKSEAVQHSLSEGSEPSLVVRP